MHRIKKWLGLSDDGTPTIAPSRYGDIPEEDVRRKQNSDDITDNESNIAILPAKPNIIPQNTGMFTNAEIWLRQRVPLRPGECLSCKLIANGVLASAASASIYYGIQRSKTAQRKLKKWNLLFGFSLGGLFITLMYQHWYQIDFFSDAKEGEKKSDRFKRLMQEDMDTYKNIYEKMKQQFGGNSEKKE